jgi:hypothetical protein
MKSRLSITISLVLAAGLLFSAAAMAGPLRQQGNPGLFGGPPSTAEKLARLSEALGLTDAQEVEMLEVLQANEARRQALHEQTMDLMGAEICQGRADGEAAILAVLDEEQAALFLEKKENRQAGGAGKGKGRRGEPRLDCSQYGDSEG